MSSDNPILLLHNQFLKNPWRGTYKDSFIVNDKISYFKMLSISLEVGVSKVYSVTQPCNS